MDMAGSAVEVIGRAALITELTRNGLEVARPERDIGADLIAYLTPPGGPFMAVPIQLKAAANRSFTINRKYETTPSLLMTFAWNLSGPGEPEFYALTYPESLSIADSFGWTATETWRVRSHWSVTSPSIALRSALDPYRVSGPRWQAVVAAAFQSSVHVDDRHPALSVDQAMAEEDEWQATPANEKYGIDEPPQVPLAELLNARGREVTLVVRSHTEGLGPKAPSGRSSDSQTSWCEGSAACVPTPPSRSGPSNDER